MIPVDLPFLNVSILYLNLFRKLIWSQIISAVRFQLPKSSSGKPPTIYAGQPIPIEIQIKTSFHWGSKGDPEDDFVMRYDIEELIKDWLVSGRKRGDFLAKVCKVVLLLAMLNIFL